jgi:hypothetical protein
MTQRALDEDEAADVDTANVDHENNDHGNGQDRWRPDFSNN